ncbi:MAG: SPFH domain-containing protein, partial [Gemmatimonadaceae bacterium]
MEFFQSAALVVGAVIVGVIAVALLTIRKLLIIAPPNFAAVITGRQRQLEDGTRIGYRTVSGGRSMRVPLVEQVQWMSLSTIPLEISVADAYSKGNIPLEVKAVANLKIASSPDAVFNNAVERLLGKPLVEIEGLARETLTGNLRGVLSKLTPEEVNEDRLGFARHLSEEADHDLKKLGLQLDVLKIQHVSDRVGYLKAMGEKATSEAIRDAEIAKANAQAETALRQAEATRVAEVATAEASTSIAEAQNLLRVRRAELSREAETAERVAKAEAERAEAEARTRLELQRVDLERTRLQADV